MRVQSIGQYYVPNLNNSSRVSARHNNITFSGENDRFITALHLLEARERLADLEEKLSNLKQQELNKRYTDYDKLKRLEIDLRMQEDLVEQLRQSYSRYCNSEDNFREDAIKGRQILAEYSRIHGSSKPEEDSGISSIWDTETPGDFQWYNPS